MREPTAESDGICSWPSADVEDRYDLCPIESGRECLCIAASFDERIHGADEDFGFIQIALVHIRRSNRLACTNRFRKFLPATPKRCIEPDHATEIFAGAF